MAVTAGQMLDDALGQRVARDEFAELRADLRLTNRRLDVIEAEQRRQADKIDQILQAIQNLAGRVDEMRRQLAARG